MNIHTTDIHPHIPPDSSTPFIPKNEDFHFSLYRQKFHGINRLFGNRALDKLKLAHVVIVGVGGVGSWAAESIVRSGVGHITLIDPDEVCVTNTNRQLHALEGQYGKYKVDLLKDRLLLINPECHIHVIKEFLTEKNIHSIFGQFSLEPHYVLDCIDSVKHKLTLITAMKERNIPVGTVGATAGKWDPTLLRSGDLGESYNDRLIMRLRKSMREHYGHEPTVQIHYGVDCIFSIEQAKYPQEDGTVCTLTKNQENKRMDCETGMGSASFVTGSAGFMLSSLCIRRLLKED